MRDLLNTTMRLVVIMLIAALCLALTNYVTQEPIKAQERATAEAMRVAVLPADEFEEMGLQSGHITNVFAGKTGGETLGYVFEITTSGYANGLQLTVGVENGKVSGVRINAHGETPGLGANATNESFLAQYTGKEAGIVVKKGAASGNEISAITAATVTSNAVTRAVNEALDYYSQNLA